MHDPTTCCDNGMHGDSASQQVQARAGVRESFDPFIDIPAGQAGSHICTALAMPFVSHAAGVCDSILAGTYLKHPLFFGVTTRQDVMSSPDVRFAYVKHDLFWP